jgi:hypothetical protein
MTAPTPKGLRPDDKPAPDTLFSRQQNELDESGGRYAKQTSTTLTGTGVPTYPKQPISSPYAKGLDEVTGPEPPLGVDIEFVGELGGASSAFLPCAEQTATHDRRGSSLTSDDPPQLPRAGG